MSPFRPAFPVFVACLAALSACKTTVPPVVHPSVKPAPTAAPVLATSPRPSVAPSQAPALVASLTGRILAPSRILANNGGNWRLLAAPAQAPVINATVTVLDAAGKPLPGVEARTDADGKYMLTATLPARNLILSVALPGTSGAVQAIVAPGATQVDGDVVSTLTTGYIVNQYARTQPDPAATLDKLPPDMEAATRAKTASALTVVPDALTPAKVVAAVESLRKQDKALDAQLEEVRKLLIPAGQSDLGNGRVATDVAIQPGGLAFAPNGDLVIPEVLGYRVWRLHDGKLFTLAGSGGAPGEPIDGLDATQAQLGVYQIAYDGQGRLLLAEYQRISRLDADGKLHLVGNIDGGLRAMAPGAGDEVTVLTADETSARAVRLAPGQPQRVLKTFTGSDLAYLINQGNLGRLGRWDGHGKLWFSQYRPAPAETAERRTFDLAALAFDAPQPGEAPENWFFDQAGNRIDGLGKSIQLTPVGGAPRIVTTQFDEQNLYGGAVAPDGTVYIAGQTRVFKVEANGALTPVAGQAGASKGDANAVSFARPVGVAVAPDGTLFVADADAGQIIRVGTDRQARVYAGLHVSEIKGTPLEEGPALQVSLGFPMKPQLDAAGNVYFLSDLARVVQVTPAGQARTSYQPPEQPSDLAVAPDGTLYVASNGGVPKLVRVPPGGKAETLLTDPAGDNQADLRLALGPDGTLYVAARGQLRTWTAKDGVKPLATHAYFDNAPDMAVDARGRIYVLGQEETSFVRFAAGAIGEPVTVAGPGTSHFAGSGADNGLSGPLGPALDAAGNLYFADSNHKQVKKIPASEL